MNGHILYCMRRKDGRVQSYGCPNGGYVTEVNCMAFEKYTGNRDSF